VGETIELVGLEEKADARTAELSGGQRRRLDLALALVGDPELVFLDEPTTGFDPAARRTAWNAVRNLRGLGMTVLLTTHYLDEAQELADRVAIVKDGRIVAQGPPSELGPGQARYRVSYLSGGRRVEHQTDDPTDLLHRLTSDALARGERLEGLEVSRPTLEDVYLELTAGDGK
jgi:ABC-2 type transport system ATP-binding protein